LVSWLGVLFGPVSGWIVTGFGFGYGFRDLNRRFGA
jgi:hypothetical protein